MRLAIATATAAKGRVLARQGCEATIDLHEKGASDEGAELVPMR